MDAIAWEELDPALGTAGARLQLHYAVQPVAAVGQSLLPKAPDDSQQSVSIAGPRAWLGAPVASGALRAGLDPEPLQLLLCDGAGARLSALPLADRTLAEALAWLRAELQARGAEASSLALPQHPADFPHHALAGGARFEAGGERARSELARFFAGSQAVLAELRSDAAAPLRLWPHHFDLGCSLQLGGLSLGLGASPGDGPAGRPYWYATPWPRPPVDALPPLDGGGRWRLQGWMGAELPLERLGRGAAAQRAQVVAFFRSAIAASRTFPGATPG